MRTTIFDFIAPVVFIIAILGVCWLIVVVDRNEKRVISDQQKYFGKTIAILGKQYVVIQSTAWKEALCVAADGTQINVSFAAIDRLEVKPIESARP